MASAQRFLAVLFKLESAVAISAYVVIAGLLLADVAMREMIGSSIWGAQRISVYLMIVTGFLGLGLAADRGRHLRPRFADILIPARFAELAERTGSALMAGVFVVFAYFGVEFAKEAFAYGDLARIIKIPLWTIQSIVPYAFLSIGVRYLLYAIWPTLKTGEALES